MKKIILLVTVVCSLISFQSFAQKQGPPPRPPRPLPMMDTPQYQKGSEMPAFKIRKLDSTTIFNTYDIPKGKPTMLMLFMPDCEHCQKQVERMIAGMDSISNVQIYLFSPLPVFKIKEFYDKYHLADYKNIVLVGQEYEFFFASYYKATSVPFIAVYNHNKKLMRAFQGSAGLKEIEMAANSK